MVLQSRCYDTNTACMAHNENVAEQSNQRDLSAVSKNLEIRNFMLRTTRVRAWLHGEFQPGLKFCSAHRAEILLRLHGQFQPGRKTIISVRKFTEFSPGWKNDSDYMDFSARAELRPGLNPSPCNRQLGFLRICFRSRSEISARLAGLKF